MVLPSLTAQRCVSGATGLRRTTEHIESLKRERETETKLKRNSALLSAANALLSKILTYVKKNLIYT